MLESRPKTTFQFAKPQSNFRVDVVAFVLSVGQPPPPVLPTLGFYFGTTPVRRCRLQAVRLFGLDPVKSQVIRPARQQVLERLSGQTGPIFISHHQPSLRRQAIAPGPTLNLANGFLGKPGRRAEQHKPAAQRESLKGRQSRTEPNPLRLCHTSSAVFSACSSTHALQGIIP